MSDKNLTSTTPEKEYSPATLDAEKSRILQAVKLDSHRGSMRPQLCQVITAGGRPLPELTLVWHYYAGMGSTAIHGLEGIEKKAALKLAYDGRLVPEAETFAEPDYRLGILRHFDDVRWGTKKDHSTIIYTLSPDHHSVDSVIETNENHEPALQRLRQYIDLGLAAKDSPITLQTADEKFEVTPILTNADIIALRRRQNAFPERDM